MFKKIYHKINDSFWGNISINTFKEFFGDKSFFHGAALAYYAVFALVPMLYLAISFFGWFVGNETVVDIIGDLLKEQVGISNIDGIIDFLNSIDFEKGSFFLNMIGAIALLISSTALLNSLRQSINTFYGVKAEFTNKKRQIIIALITKLFSILMLTGIGVMIIILYFSETVLLSLSSDFLSDFVIIDDIVAVVLQNGITILTNVIIFLFVFKYLHDGIITWKIALFGAVFTGVLLYLGQWMIKYYLTNYFFGASGGVAGSLLILLVWMYYSSQIIFLGAKFVKIYAIALGKPIVSRVY
jgi:membrane protein